MATIPEYIAAPRSSLLPSATNSGRRWVPIPQLSGLKIESAFYKRAFLSYSRRTTRPGPRPSISCQACERGTEYFASISSSSTQATSSIGVNPQLTVPSSASSNVGSPLFWIGVGVGLSALFSWAATNLKKYAMQQAFKTLMGQMESQNTQFNNPAFSSGSAFPFPAPSTAAPSVPSATPPVSSKPVTVDVPPTKVEAVSTDEETKKETKQYAFVDVSPDETLQSSPFESSAELKDTFSSIDAPFAEKVSQNGVAAKQDITDSGSSQSTREASSVLSVEALEKMMEDPTVQKMVYPLGYNPLGNTRFENVVETPDDVMGPESSISGMKSYLPEEMRNPATFKWMLQNPQYRQQLQDMLNNMGGSAEWDNRMMDSLKNFDLSSPEVKQQFDQLVLPRSSAKAGYVAISIGLLSCYGFANQIGMTPEEVISKIMANPEVAMAFQNPRVQAAIMDCSQNPLSIAKYQNDKEVMDVFNKISELFPGVTGS
ncbi:STI1/HOP, DP domain [Dillenia turbinata]|uniref:Protein TIC 40, chloroplastic n=1 Tax=Dillenia turbinata TaxID=194707 RepID=A0AAN8W3X5_9MAGN